MIIFTICIQQINYHNQKIYSIKITIQFLPLISMNLYECEFPCPLLIIEARYSGNEKFLFPQKTQTPLHPPATGPPHPPTIVVLTPPHPPNPPNPPNPKNPGRPHPSPRPPRPLCIGAYEEENSEHDECKISCPCYAMKLLLCLSSIMIAVV